MVKKMIGLPPGTTTTSSGVTLMPRELETSCGDGLAQFRQSGGGAVMGVAFAQRVDTGFDDVGGRVHVGLADFEMDNVSSLPLEGAGANQHLEGGFRSQPRHALGQAQFGLSCSHRQSHDYTTRRRCRSCGIAVVAGSRENAKASTSIRKCWFLPPFAPACSRRCVPRRPRPST